MVAGQRPAGDFEQQVVLPEAEREGDAEDDDADDDPDAQLVEVLDEAEAVLMGDRPDAAGHPRAPQLRLSAATSASAGSLDGPRPSASEALSALTLVLVVVVVVVAGDRAFELADAAAEAAARAPAAVSGRRRSGR